MNAFSVKMSYAMLAAIVVSAVAGCTTTSPRDAGSTEAHLREIDSGAKATLTRLYEAEPASRDLIAKASGVLIFPSVLDVSLGVGMAHGDGELRENGKVVAYYTTTSGSIGLQAGAQTQSTVFLFMTPASLAAFRSHEHNGWTAGVDATVAVARFGANGNLDTATAQAPVVGFVLTKAGLMAGVSVEGTKVSRLTG